MSTASETYQSVALDSKEGRQFLRRVLRDNANSSWDGGWCASARSREDWRLHFRRTIKGKTGEPDVSVEVSTDMTISLSGKTGSVQSFSDSKPVIVPTPRRILLHSTDLSALTTLLLHGADRLTIETSAGSTSSSYHGLAFASLQVRVAPEQWGSVEVGTATVWKDGQRIISGVVDD